MSDPKRINEKELLEKEQISPYGVLDFLFHYEWTHKMMVTFTGWGGNWNPMVKLGMWTFYMFILWVPLCLGWRYLAFFTCSVIRLVTNKGGQRGLPVTLFYIGTYISIFFLVYIPIIIPTYWNISSTTFLEWLKVI